ncbi:MAG TPA: hypothetical protein VLC54_03110 [Anaeromyxobacter sp.]|nr:hypothetical protein [Anaeromyxobacter sp.]
MSDGTGAVALGARDDAGNGSWHTFTADGSPRSSFAAWPLYTQPVGWQGATIPRADGPWMLGAAVLTFSPSGELVRREEVAAHSQWVSATWLNLQQDPAGGSVLFIEGATIQYHDYWWSEVVRFAASGEWRSRGGEGLDFMVAGGVTNRGDALAWSYSAIRGRTYMKWVAPDGAISTWGDLTLNDLCGSACPDHDYFLPLLDGSLVLVEDGAYTRRLAYRTFALDAAPGWLASRAGWTFRFTRGNRGYAALEPAGRSAADCTQRIDLVSPGGRLCGRITLHEEGEGCVTGSVDQGWDGTVVQQSGMDSCNFRWWPGLLAGD